MEKFLRIVLGVIFWLGVIPLFAQVSPAKAKANSIQITKPGTNRVQTQHPRVASLKHKKKGKAPTIIPPLVVINKYCNKPTSPNEWIEFMVTGDNVDMSNWKFSDDNQTQTSVQTPLTTFKPVPLWTHLRTGTVIVVWVGTHAAHVIKTDGYIEVSSDNTTYFTPGVVVNIAGNADLIHLYDPSSSTLDHIKFGHDAIPPNFVPGPSFTNGIPEPKLSCASSLTDTYAVVVSPGDTITHYGYAASGNQEGLLWATTVANGDAIMGLPNPPNPANPVASTTPNSDFWRKLRQPTWTAQPLTFTYDPGNTKVTMAWTAATDAYPADKTQGYMIVRNTVNTFGDPMDGHTYIPGDAVTGGGTVIDTVNSSQTITRVDNTIVPNVLCSGGYFYRVYAFRYTTDAIHGNDYNVARGRAYNETRYASGLAQYPATVPPTSATITPNIYCTAGPIPPSVLLEAPGGSGGSNGATGTLNWYLGGCGTENGGTLLGAGTGANNSYTYTTPPTAPGTYTFYARWENACSKSPCVTATVTVSAILNPSFTPMGPYCINSTAPGLPAASNEGITGSWSPSTINTTVSGTITYTFTPDAGQCANPATMNIIITDQVAPLFAQIGPLCQNSTPPTLPAVSTNGINGTWSPPTINTGTIGTTTYTFTPVAGQCSLVFTMDITIASQITPTFPQIGPYCQNSNAPSLPTTSLEGITGTWSPATINTSTVGSFPFTFTPGGGQCGIPATITIVIATQITPTFTQIGPLCQFSAEPALPAESINGITGTWFPANISTAVAGTSDYVFAPDPGQCGVNYTMHISVAPVIVPTFAQIGPLCQNSFAPVLQPTSLNGITGIWNPSTVSTTTIGTTPYIFTPATGQCGIADTMNIEVTTSIIPTFNAISDQCQNSQPPQLPPTSLNGISGTWVPATISTATTGATTYTFTPAGGQCSLPTTLTVNVNTGILPTINITGSQTKVCAGASVNISSVVTNEGPTPTYQWLLDGSPVGTGASSYSYTPVADGQVWCKLTSSLACAANPAFSDTLSITVSPVPVVKLTDKDYLCSGTPSELDAGPGYTGYQWQDGSTDRYYTASSPGQYWVSVTNGAGCTGISDTVLLKVCETGIYVPSGFSPNGDGVNDVFKAVATLDANTSFSMIISNRWGETVFESHNIFDGWDGTYAGQLMPPGTYAWRIDYKSVNSTDSKPVVLKGVVTLIR